MSIRFLMSLTVLPPLIDHPSEEQTLVKQDIPCDILNPVRPATDIKTLGISEQQLYWYGETYKQREVITYPNGIAWMGPIGFEKIIMDPMNEPTDYLTWFFSHPLKNGEFQPVKFNLRCDGSFNQKAGGKLIQYHTAYLVAQLYQLLQQSVDLNTTVGTLYAKPLQKVTVLELWTYGASNRQSKVPIQFDSQFHRRPEEFERMVNGICKALGQTAVFPIYSNDNSPTA